MTRLEVGAIGPVSVGARLYRWRGQRLLGVVVKASYSLQHRQEMTPIAPMDWRARANAAHAGDEPFPLGSAEVVVGPLPQPARAPGNAIALTITRGPQMVLDVRRRAGDEGARDAAAGFGPVPATSPLRAAHAASTDLAELRGVREVTLDPRLDPAFFQAAPLAQRIDELRAGDAVALLGMSHLAKAIQTTIPHDAGHAVVEVDGGAPRRVTLRRDRLHVAPDAMVAELSFRGMIELPGDAVRVRVAGGLESPTRPFVALPFDALKMWPVEAIEGGMPAPEEPPPPTQVLGPPVPHGGTLVIAPTFESTAVLAPDARAPTSLPFRKSLGSSPHAVPAGPIPGAPWDDVPATPAPPVVVTSAEERPPETVILAEERPPETVVLAGKSPDAELVDLRLDEPSVAEAATERQPVPPLSPPEPPAPAAHVARKKVDPWRKDPDLAPPAPVPPPPAPKASPTRADISGGLYKKFKR